METRKILKRIRKLEVKEGDILVMPDILRRHMGELMDVLNRTIPKKVMVVFGDVRKLKKEELKKIPAVLELIKEAKKDGSKT